MLVVLVKAHQKMLMFLVMLLLLCCAACSALTVTAPSSFLHF